MANTSVSGLVSGLDTATIISQLMQLEAQPQTNLKNRVTAEKSVVTALQAINAKLAGIATKAGDLASLTNWSPATATSSNDKVTVHADQGAAATQFGFTVEGVASAYKARFATTATSTTATGTMPANAQYTVTFDDGRTAFNFSTGDGSLKSIAAALNVTGSGVQASLVPVADPNGALTYALSVQDAHTGSTSGFKITPTGNTSDTTSFLGGADATATTPGTNASILIDGQGTALTSSTNTFTDLMPGLDVTLGAGATGPATITVAQDTKGMSDSVKAMVDAVNSVLSDIDTQTGYDATTKKSGPLAGESLLRDVRDKLLSAVTNGVNGKSLADVGIQVDRYGKLVLDEAKFQAAYAADPTGVAAQFTAVSTTTDPTTGATTTTPVGLAATLASITKTASDPFDGTLTLSIKGHSSEITSMQDAIDDWDVRLQQRQGDLQRQFTAMEVALGKLQDQASWLNGQIAGLPSMGH